MKSNNLFVNRFMENYRIFGGADLDEESPSHKRVFILLNQKHQYFEDTKTHNSFVKIRREHFNKIPCKKYVELDFYEVRHFLSLIYIYSLWILKRNWDHRDSPRHKKKAKKKIKNKHYLA